MASRGEAKNMKPDSNTVFGDTFFGWEGNSGGGLKSMSYAAKAAQEVVDATWEFTKMGKDLVSANEECGSDDSGVIEECAETVVPQSEEYANLISMSAANVAYMEDTYSWNTTEMLDPNTGAYDQLVSTADALSMILPQMGTGFWASCASSSSV